MLEYRLSSFPRLGLLQFIAGILSGTFLSFMITWKFLRGFNRKSNFVIRDQSTLCSQNFVFLIHGGAGVVTGSLDTAPYYDSLKRITAGIFEYVKANHGSNITAVDVVEYGVALLEDCPLFNAGRGAVYTSEETHELEASIMDGTNRKAGAVSLIKTVKNPISLARIIMNSTTIPHSYLVGEAAEAIASQSGLERVQESYYSTPYRLEQLHTARSNKKVMNDHDLLRGKGEEAILSRTATDASTGTVGCVCLYNGHVAAATSTGGLTNKYPGRIGDTPIIGAGTYADDRSCAVSTTGRGEQIMAHVAAYDISARMRIGGQQIVDAVKQTVHEHLPTDTCGVIAVDGYGNYAMEFNTSGMFRAMCNSEGKCCMGIWHETQTFSLSD